MRPASDNGRYLNLVLVAFLVAAFVFASPFYLLWMAPGTPWYVPYLLWLAVILVTGALRFTRGRHGL